MTTTYTFSNLAAFDLKNTELIGKQDPYVVFDVGQHRFQTKQCNKGGTSPVWNDVVTVHVPTATNLIKVFIYNDNTLRPDSLIGSSELHLPIQTGRVHLVDKKGSPSGELRFDVSAGGDAGHGGHHTGHLGSGVGTGSAMGAAAGTGAGVAGHHHHSPGSGVGSHHTSGPGAGGIGGGYPTSAPVGSAHHHHGPGTVGQGSTVPGTGYGPQSGVGHHNAPGTGTFDTSAPGIAHQGGGLGGNQGGYHHEEKKSHRNESESYTETYGPGGEPTMTQRAKHAANEGVESMKDHIPGMHGHHTPAPGTGPEGRRY